VAKQGRSRGSYCSCNGPRLIFASVGSHCQIKLRHREKNLDAKIGNVGGKIQAPGHFVGATTLSITTSSIRLGVIHAVCRGRHFVNLPLNQIGTLSIWHCMNLPLRRQLTFSSSLCCIKLPFLQLAILST
jgi:hypothetical protein